MKGILILLLLLTAGCSAFVPTEQLEAEALVTGDWSRVEQRHRMIERRKKRGSISCPSGTIGYCEVGVSADRCTCVDSGIISAYLGR